MATVTGVTADYVDTQLAGKAAALHAANHGVAGSDPVTLAQSQITGLVTDLGGKAAKGDIFVNVKDYGATGNGATDDAAAIQSAIDNSPAGATIFFPPGTYIVGTTIKLLMDRTYRGPGRQKTSVKMKNGANLNAVMASETWLSTTSTTSDNPIDVRDLKIDANNTNQTSGAGHGLALITFWNTLENLDVVNCRGNGILLTSKRFDGTEVSNTAVECKVIRCNVRTVAQTLGVSGAGIMVEDPTSSVQNVTDGWIVDCIIQTSNGHGIVVNTPAGWLIQGNHIYGAKASGIYFDRGGYLRIISNYIETWGSSTTAGTYAGIQGGGDGVAFVGAASPIIIANNNLFYTSGAAATTVIRGIVVSTANGITSHLIIVGNAVQGATVTTTSNGIRITNQGSTSTTFVTLASNMVYGWDVQYGWSANGGGLYSRGDTLQTGLANATTDGFTRIPSTAGIPSGTPADLTNGIPIIYDSTNNKLYIYNGSWQGVGGAPTASPTFTGTVTYSGRQVSTPDTVTISAGHAAIDASLGNTFDIAANANFTLDNPTNPTDGQVIHIRITQDATGGRTISLGSAFATGPNTVTLSTAANKRDHMVAMYNAAASKWDVTGFQAGF